MAQYYEVRGSYTVTVAKAVYARSEEEAMQIVEDMDIDLTTYADGTVGTDDAKVEADGMLEWKEASDTFYYTDESEADEEECKEYWYDYDPDEDEEEEDDE